MCHEKLASASLIACILCKSSFTWILRVVVAIFVVVVVVVIVVVAVVFVLVVVVVVVVVCGISMSNVL